MEHDFKTKLIFKKIFFTAPPPSIQLGALIR